MTIESEGCPESAPSAAADAQGRATAMPHHYLLVAAALALSIGVSVLLLAFPEPIDRLGGLGYAGAFLVMAVNNATILLPSLGHAFIVAAAQTLNPFLLGVAGGIGGGLGELTGYALGKAGYNVMGHYRAMQTIRRCSRGQHFGPVLFVFAATPLPMDVAGILAGASHYDIRRFMLWVGAGKVVNTILIAIASYYALGWLQRVSFWG